MIDTPVFHADNLLNEEQSMMKAVPGNIDEIALMTIGMTFINDNLVKYTLITLDVIIMFISTVGYCSIYHLAGLSTVNNQSKN